MIPYSRESIKIIRNPKHIMPSGPANRMRRLEEIEFIWNTKMVHKKVSVTEDTVIYWELRWMKPWRRDVRDKMNQFVENESGGKFVTSEHIIDFKRLISFN